MKSMSTNEALLVENMTKIMKKVDTRFFRETKFSNFLDRQTLTVITKHLRCVRGNLKSRLKSNPPWISNVKVSKWRNLGELSFDRSKLGSFRLAKADLDVEILNQNSRFFQMRESILERLIGTCKISLRISLNLS